MCPMPYCSPRRRPPWAGRWTSGAGSSAPCGRAPGEALARLGLPPVPIVPGLRGAPQWPSGIVGSMTHCAGYRASAVARMQDMLILGLDAEPDHRLPDGVLDAIATADERAGTVRPRVRGADAILGPAAVQRQGVGLQGMVPADPALAGLR